MSPSAERAAAELLVTVTCGLANLAMGLAYIGLGFLAVDEMRKLHTSRGLSIFGLAWCAMAFTCGPHHLVHALHAQEGEGATVWELLALLVSLPPGLIFVALRIEALRGGRGDRFIYGTPWWLRGACAAFGAVTGIVVIGAAIQGRGVANDGFAARATVPISAVLAALYGLVGWYLARTQLRRRKDAGGWSVSGLALTLVFPTCALTHIAYALAGANDVHTFVIDVLVMPASIWFLVVVRGLYLEHVDDWNNRPLVGTAGVPQRPAPWHVHDLRAAE